MQNAGSLRKRTTRNIIKIQYVVENKRSLAKEVNPTKDASEEQKSSPSPSKHKNTNATTKTFFNKATKAKLKAIVKLGSVSFLFPLWRIEDKPGSPLEIRRHSSPTLNRIWKAAQAGVILLSSILTSIHIYYFVQYFRQATTSYRTTFMYMAVVFWNSHGALWGAILFANGEKMRRFLNSMFRLNADLFGSETGTEAPELGGGLFMNFSIPGYFAQVLISATRYCLQYDAPVYMTARIWGSNSPYWFLLLGLVQDFLTSGHCIAGSLFVGWLTVTYAESMSYWLRESVEMKEEGLEVYRKLQVLSKVFDTSVGTSVVPMCAFQSWSAAVSCGYVAFRNLNHLFIDEFPNSVFYPLGTMITLCAAYGQFHMGALVNDMSGGWLDDWCRTEDMNERRVLVSCPKLRIGAGYLTTVTRGSLVTYFYTVSDHVIGCIMSFP